MAHRKHPQRMPGLGYVPPDKVSPRHVWSWNTRRRREVEGPRAEKPTVQTTPVLHVWGNTPALHIAGCRMCRTGAPCKEAGYKWGAR
jgi:hypothetical protein